MDCSLSLNESPQPWVGNVSPSVGPASRTTTSQDCGPTSLHSSAPHVETHSNHKPTDRRSSVCQCVFTLVKRVEQSNCKQKKGTLSVFIWFHSCTQVLPDWSSVCTQVLPDWSSVCTHVLPDWSSLCTQVLPDWISVCTRVLPDWSSVWFRWLRIRGGRRTSAACRLEFSYQQGLLKAGDLKGRVITWASEPGSLQTRAERCLGCTFQRPPPPPPLLPSLFLSPLFFFFFFLVFVFFFLLLLFILLYYVYV